MKGLTHAQSAELKQSIIEYRKQGHFARECAEHFKVSIRYVYYVCRGVDYQWKCDNETMKASAQKWADEHREEIKGKPETIINMINKRLPDFEYVGGYVNSEGSADIRCRKCGEILTRSYPSIKQGTVRCPRCAKREADRKKREQEAEQELKKLQKELTRRCEQTSLKVCPVCKSVFVGNKTYCSDACRDRNKYMMKDGYRHRFPLIDVYNRDKGICWLCGRPCNWEDYEVKDGVIIYGDTYPSRDHVVPKSKGGLHAWDNIRLAHRWCNSVKRDAVIPSPIHDV